MPILIVEGYVISCVIGANLACHPPMPTELQPWEDRVDSVGDGIILFTNSVSKWVIEIFSNFSRKFSRNSKKCILKNGGGDL